MRRENTLIALGLLLSCLLIFLAPVLSGHYIYYFHDLKAFYLPCRALYNEILGEGRLLLWTELASAGFPVHAEGQTGVFYPLNMILHGIFSWQLAFAFSLLFHYFLAGAGTYGLARHCQISRFGSMLAGLSFMLSGFMISHLFHVSILTASSWLPIILLTGCRSVRERNISLPWMLLSGSAIAMQLLAGHPQITLITLIGLTSVITTRILLSHGLSPRTIGELGIIVVIVLIGICLASVQVFPTLEMLPLTSRGQTDDIAFLLSGSFPPHHMIMSVFPYFFGVNAWPMRQVSVVLTGEEATWPWTFGGLSLRESHIYGGILPMILAFCGLISIINSRRDNQVSPDKAMVPFAILGILGMLLMLGKYSPLYFLWELFGPLLPIRFPARFILLFTVSLALFSGLGWDFLEKRGRRAWHYTGMWTLLVTLLTLILFSALAQILPRYDRQHEIGEVHGFASEGNDEARESPDERRGQSTFGKLRQGLASACEPTSPATALQFIMLFLTGLTLVAAGMPMVNARVGRSLLLVVSLIDLMSFGLLYNPLMATRTIEQQPETVKAIMRNGLGEFDRLAVLDSTQPQYRSEMESLYGDGAWRALIHPNQNFLYRLASVGNPSPLILAEREALLEKAGLGFKPEDHGIRLQKFLHNTDVTNFLRIRFLLTNQATDLPEPWRLIAQSEGAFLFQQDLIEHAIILIAPDNVLVEGTVKINNPKDSSKQEIVPGTVVEDRPRLVSFCVLERTAGAVHMRISASKEAYAFVPDTWYPGWKALVNGVERPILRGQHLFNVLLLEEGENDIRLSFCPSSLRIGLFISLASLMVLLIMLIGRYGDTRERDRNGDSQNHG